MPDDNQKTYSITIQNAPEQTKYSLYVGSFPGQLAGGVVSGENYSLTIGSEHQGEGKIKFLVPTRTREFSNIFFSVPITADGKDVIVDLAEYFSESPQSLPVSSSSTNTQAGDKKKFLQNDLTDKVQERQKELTAQEESSTPKKKFLQNDLREKVQERKSFWNKFK